MSVKVRPYKRGGWEVDVRVVLPNGTELRERRRAPVPSKSAAKRWGEARERELVVNPTAERRKEVPTLQEFATRFVEGHARANRHKPSGIAAKETILRVHLVPRLGGRTLDSITTEDVQRLKNRLGAKAPKTVNNVLTTLNMLLKVAVEWGVIDEMPCTIRLLKVPRVTMAFHDFEAFGRIVEAARAIDADAVAIVLLGGEAGLRCGEMMALEQRDVDFHTGQVCVRYSDWKGHVTVPKGGHIRHVPMTARLNEALRHRRHLRGDRVLTGSDGRPYSQKMVQDRVRWAARRASIEEDGVHTLRHTFCSHLVMRGAPVKAIQELAGHQDLSTTQRYMHLSPAALDAAIRLLDRPKAGTSFGDILETGGGRIGK